MTKSSRLISSWQETWEDPYCLKVIFLQVLWLKVSSIETWKKHTGEKPSSCKYCLLQSKVSAKTFQCSYYKEKNFLMKTKAFHAVIKHDRTKISAWKKKAVQMLHLQNTFFPLDTLLYRFIQMHHQIQSLHYWKWNEYHIMQILCPNIPSKMQYHKTWKEIL